MVLPKCSALTSTRAASRKVQLSSEEKEIAQLKQGSRQMDFDHKSLASRGYLRAQKPYSPPEDVVDVVLRACEESTGTTSPDLSDPNVKFSVLSKCVEQFNHHLPNSLLHSINDLESIVEYFSTPVDTRFPLDRMKDIDLPKNLHIEYKYHRFNPETDTMFDGVSVFSGESQIVPSLKYKKKYKGYKAEPEWLKYKHYV